MDLIDRVTHDLAEDGELRPLNGTDFAIMRFRDRRFMPPVRLRLDGVAEYLESMSEDAVQVFPEVPVRQGAYRLLLVHLEESLLATGGRPVTIAIGSRGLDVSRATSGDEAAGTKDAAGGDWSWTTQAP